MTTSVSTTKRIYLSTPTMNGNEMKYIQEAFDANWIAPLGPNVDSFERELAAYVGVSCGAALSSGTAAIHLALKLAGVDQGDTVFCSALTFSATCNPIRYQNATPVFIDSEDATWNMSPTALEKAFEKHPDVKAVIVVNLFGTPAKLDQILEICKAHGVPLIEDAAESLGARYRSKQTGTFGKYGVFSFNGNKIITTSGGGMLVSEDEVSIKKARYWATQAREPARHYQHTELGYNYRMSNVVAGIGRGQLHTLDQHIARKRAIFETYREALLDIEEVRLNPYLPCSEPNFWLSCIEIDQSCSTSPLDIMAAFDNANIECRPIWKPMQMQPYYAGYDFIIDATCVSQRVFERGLCLPSDIKMTQDDQARVIEVIRGQFSR